MLDRVYWKCGVLRYVEELWEVCKICLVYSGNCCWSGLGNNILFRIVSLLARKRHWKWIQRLRSSNDAGADIFTSLILSLFRMHLRVNLLLLTRMRDISLLRFALPNMVSEKIWPTKAVFSILDRNEINMEQILILELLIKQLFYSDSLDMKWL